ncbi:universal stress protein Slr1101 isoform X2 [Nematostella vectensis]|uniref:universal stress protein Slr1101 isoform X2 n=1 Tax=Nematostella vectensis TaxID=45351 RepID=UPI0013902FEB|nr:universal stress protein Slr1101 isoform X2 [Nematostella vectensis]
MAKPEDYKRRVLIPMDYSKHSEEALNYYYNRIFKDGEDYLTILHVSCLHPPALPHALATEDWRQECERHEKKITDWEQKMKEKLEKMKIPATVLVVMEKSGGLGHTVCHVAKETERRIDLIVMGNRGMGVVRRTILGSVSDYVIHHAHIPVLLVPKNHGDKESHVQCQQTAE